MFHFVLDLFRRPTVCRCSVCEVIQSSEEWEIVSLCCKFRTPYTVYVLGLWIAFLEQNPSLEEPWNLLIEHKASMTASSHTEDVVEFFECPLLRLWKEEKYEEECNHIQGSIKAEGAGGAKCCKNGRERYG